MKFEILSSDYDKLLQYTDSICVDIHDGVLMASSKLKGLETIVAFRLQSHDNSKEFFAVTLDGPAAYFKGLDAVITIDVSQNILDMTDGFVSVTVPITRDVIADFTMPSYNEETAVVLDKKTRFGLRSMLTTMQEVSKALLDYSGTYVYIKGGKATCINCSMVLECEVALPDMCVSASALLNVLSLTNNAETVTILNEEMYALFITKDIVIRVYKEKSTDSITADGLLSTNRNVELTEVAVPGLAQRLKALSSFRDSTTASISYTENAFGVSMRGTGYVVNANITGHTVFINPRVLIVLGKFLNSDKYTIERGEKHVCLSIPGRKLVICATSF